MAHTPPLFLHFGPFTFVLTSFMLSCLYLYCIEKKRCPTFHEAGSWSQGGSNTRPSDIVELNFSRSLSQLSYVSESAWMSTADAAESYGDGEGRHLR